jgi:hypothetical protein
MKNQFNGISKCRQYYNTIPNLTPEMYSLSTYSSNNGTYTTVYVTGKNFLINNTYIKFGNVNLPVIFYSSLNISFVVQTFNVQTYNVNAVNQINYSAQYQPSTLYSNTLEYQVL